MRGRRRGWTGVRGTRPGAKASLPSSAVRLWPHKRSYFSAQRNGTTNAHGERERAWGWRKGILQDVLICRRFCPALGSWHVAGQLLPGRNAELGEGLVEVVAHGTVASGPAASSGRPARAVAAPWIIISIIFARGGWLLF